MLRVAERNKKQKMNISDLLWIWKYYDKQLNIERIFLQYNQFVSHQHNIFAPFSILEPLISPANVQVSLCPGCMVYQLPEGIGLGSHAENTDTMDEYITAEQWGAQPRSPVIQLILVYTILTWFTVIYINQKINEYLLELKMWWQMWDWRQDQELFRTHGTVLLNDPQNPQHHLQQTWHFPGNAYVGLWFR